MAMGARLEMAYLRERDFELVQINDAYRAQNDALRALNAEMLEALKAASDHLYHAQFDYSNGNTDSTGMIDEGNVYGWRAHDELLVKIGAAIAKATEAQP